MGLLHRGVTNYLSHKVNEEDFFFAIMVKFDDLVKKCGY